MNHLQFILFFVFLFSTLVAGTRVYIFLNPSNSHDLNRFVFLGEVLLLGAIIVVGELMVLSIAGLYSAIYLWSVVLLNGCFLISQAVRRQLRKQLLSNLRWRIPSVIFFLAIQV